MRAPSLVLAQCPWISWWDIAGSSSRHAAFFGVGAYAAGIFALRASAEPLAGLLVGGVAAAIVGVLSGVVLLRGRRLTLIMLSLATVLLLQETANKLGWLTGGADGLQGIAIGPVAGRFTFDLFGRVSYAYAAVVLALAFLVFRSIVDSPFGKSLVGIRENEGRMRAIGTPVDARLRAAFVSPRQWPVWRERSRRSRRIRSPERIERRVLERILIMLIPGGAGRRYGAFLGAPVTSPCRTISRGRTPRTGICGLACCSWRCVSGSGRLAAGSMPRRALGKRTPPRACTTLDPAQAFEAIWIP